MPFDFGQIEPNQVGQVSRWDMPMSSWMGLRFAEGEFSRVGPRITDFLLGRFDDSPTLSPKEANAQFGIPGYLTFDSPVQAERARYMHERKLKELEIQSYAESAAHNAISPNGIAGFGAMVAGSLMHPLDAAVNFIPFVGSEAKAASVLKLGGNAVERALARRLITQETIAKLPILEHFPNFGRSLIDATAGNAAIEIPNFILNARDQAVYGPEDAIYNVMLGGLVGGALGHGIHTALALAHAGYSRLRPETRDNMFKEAMGAGLRGEQPNLGAHGSVDETAIRDKAQFDEATIREQALQQTVGPEEAKARAALEALNQGEVSPTDVLAMAQRAVAEEGDTPRAKILTALLDRFKAGERGVGLFENLAGLFDLRYNPLAPTLQEAYKHNALFGPLRGATAEAAGMLKDARTELFRVNQAIEAARKQLGDQVFGKTPEAQVLRQNIAKLETRSVELQRAVQQGGEALARATLSPEVLQTHAGELAARGVPADSAAVAGRRAALEARVASLREERVNAFIEAKRQEWDAAVRNQPSEQMTKEIRAAQDAGKLMSDEQVKTLVDAKSEQATAALTEHANEIQQALESMGVDPKKELAETFKPRDKAIKQAVTCLL